MRLCLQFGCTLDELGQRMTAAEFGLWIALWEDEPWGDVRADIRGGAVAATVANYAGRMRPENSAAAQPHDFMPYLKGPEKAPAPEPDPIAHFKALRK